MRRMSQFVSRRTALAAMAAGVATVGLPGTAAAHAQEGPHSTTGPDSTWVLPGDQAAKEGDPEADEVVKQLVGASQMTLANQVFHAWTRNDQPVPAEAPPVLRDFLQRNTVLTAQERTPSTVSRTATRSNSSSPTWKSSRWPRRSAACSSHWPTRCWRLSHYSDRPAGRRGGLKPNAQTELSWEGRHDVGPPRTVRYEDQILPAATSARVTRAVL